MTNPTTPATTPAPTTITRIELTDVQKRKWIETRSALLWKCPAFTHVLFSMLNPDRGELAAVFTKDVPIAATDGSNLILNPEKFFTYSLDERVFIVAHEILHCILNHCVLGYHMSRAGVVKYVDGSQLPYDQQLMNVAMDLVINDTLISDRIGSFPKEGCHDTSVATKDTSFVDAYKKVWKDPQKFPGGGFDVLLAPGTSQGKDPGTAAQGRSQTEWDTAVAGALAVAKAQGKLPASLERLLSEIVDPAVSWQDHIRGFFARRVGGGGFDWRKPDKRFIQRDIFVPRRAGNGCGPVVVGVDTSGSIGQKELDHFFAEMRGILDDVQPERIYVVWCDAQVHKVDEIEDSSDVTSLKPHGGGGTDFRPVFDWVETNGIRPDALVYLTDMMGSFPEAAPPYPVIWGDIYGRCKAPFGDVVSVPIGKK